MQYKKQTLLEIIGFLIMACLLLAKFSMSIPLYTSPKELTLLVNPANTTTNTSLSPELNSTYTSSVSTGDLNIKNKSSEEWNIKMLQTISKVFEVIGCLLMVTLIIAICLFWIYNMVESENNLNRNFTNHAIPPMYLHLPHDLVGIPHPPAYTIYYPD